MSAPRAAPWSHGHPFNPFTLQRTVWGVVDRVKPSNGTTGTRAERPRGQPRTVPSMNCTTPTALSKVPVIPELVYPASTTTTSPVM